MRQSLVLQQSLQRLLKQLALLNQQQLQTCRYCPKPVAKPVATGAKPRAQKPAASKQTTPTVVNTTEADSIKANTAVITRNKVGSVDDTCYKSRIEHVPNVRVLLGSRSSDATVHLLANMVVLNSGNGRVSTISANRGTSVGVRGGKIATMARLLDTAVTLKPTSIVRMMHHSCLKAKEFTAVWTYITSLIMVQFDGD